MKKIAKVITAGSCVAALTASSLFIPTYLKSDDIKPAGQQVTNTASVSAGAAGDTNKEAGKVETVYSFLKTDGSSYKTIVSDWVKNPESLKSLSDTTSLEGIEIVKGNGTYDGKKWSLDGNDIYYRGTSQKSLPVDMEIRYFLDDKEMSADEIKGKSGKVRIRFEFTNNEKSEVTIDGEKTTMYVPFMTLTGFILGNDHFKNVEITNGRIINDGGTTLVAGYAFPGLGSNLGLEGSKSKTSGAPASEKGGASESSTTPAETTGTTTPTETTGTTTPADNSGNGTSTETDATANTDTVEKIQEKLDALSIPDYFEVTADAKDFTLSNTYTIVTDTVFRDIALDDATDLSDISSSMGKLTDAMTEILKGSDSLYAGIGTIAEKLGTLKDGTSTILDGSKALSEGTTKLGNGITELDSKMPALKKGTADLADGAAKLNTGVSTLVTSLNTLTNGLKDLKTGLDKLNAGAKELNTGLASANTGAKDLAKGAKDLNDGLTKVSSQSDNLRAGALQVFNSLLDNANTSLAQAGVTVKLTKDNYSSTLTALIAQMNKAGNKRAAGMLTQLKTNLDSYNQFYTGLNTYTQGVDQLSAGSAKLETGATTLSAGLEKLVTGANQLATGIASADTGITTITNALPTLAAKLPELTNGVSALSTGAKTLDESVEKVKEALDTMAAGTPALTQGAQKLVNGLSELLDGTTKLETAVSTSLLSGAGQLNEGLKTFNKDGVEKITSLFKGTDIIGRINATAALAKDYDNFTGIADNTSGSVNFIYRTDNF